VKVEQVVEIRARRAPHTKGASLGRPAWCTDTNGGLTGIDAQLSSWSSPSHDFNTPKEGSFTIATRNSRVAVEWDITKSAKREINS
jgi:hypothetical protein